MPIRLRPLGRSRLIPLNYHPTCVREGPIDRLSPPSLKLPRMSEILPLNPLATVPTVRLSSRNLSMIIGASPKIAWRWTSQFPLNQSVEPVLQSQRLCRTANLLRPYPPRNHPPRRHRGRTRLKSPNAPSLECPPELSDRNPCRKSSGKPLVHHDPHLTDPSTRHQANLLLSRLLRSPLLPGRGAGRRDGRTSPKPRFRLWFSVNRQRARPRRR